MKPGILNHFEGDPIKFRHLFRFLTHSEEDVSEFLGEVAGGIDVELAAASRAAFTAVDLEREYVCCRCCFWTCFSNTFLQYVTTACLLGHKTNWLDQSLQAEEAAASGRETCSHRWLLDGH